MSLLLYGRRAIIEFRERLFLQYLIEHGIAQVLKQQRAGHATALLEVEALLRL